MIEQLNTFNEKDIKNKKGNINKLINDSALEKIIEFIKYCLVCDLKYEVSDIIEYLTNSEIIKDNKIKNVLIFFKKLLCKDDLDWINENKNKLVDSGYVTKEYVDEIIKQEIKESNNELINLSNKKVIIFNNDKEIFDYLLKMKKIENIIWEIEKKQY